MKHRKTLVLLIIACVCFGCEQKENKNGNVYNNSAKKTTVSVNGITYSGKNVNVIGNKVIVDGKEYDIKSNSNLSLNFN